ncbi:MAG: hypothetical protein IMF06_09525 [Proteobacteria bacterium]|nr:hypothetical protein [Pseudomonadota bacterium]
MNNDFVTVPEYSTRAILNATLTATAIAVAAFVTLVLPAEFGTDPTGIGSQLGLMGLSGEASQEPATIANGLPLRTDEVTVTVPPHKGIEYKFYLPQYGTFSYQWTSGATSLEFDFHGEPEGDTTGYFESYTLANSSHMQGSMTVPFAGSHGWYWKNTSGEPVSVTLITEGRYRIIGLK